jgi:hypothetical protein
MVPAESHAVDQITNACSIFNIIENIGAAVGLIPKIELITIWVREEGDEGKDFQALLRVSDNQGRIGPDFSMNFQMTAPRHRTFHSLVGIPIRSVPNMVMFEMLLNGDVVARYQVPVQEAQPISAT